MLSGSSSGLATGSRRRAVLHRAAWRRAALDAPIADEAEVSVRTLYNHFGTRTACSPLSCNVRWPRWMSRYTRSARDPSNGSGNRRGFHRQDGCRRPRPVVRAILMDDRLFNQLNNSGRAGSSRHRASRGHTERRTAPRHRPVVLAEHAGMVLFHLQRAGLPARSTTLPCGSVHCTHSTSPYWPSHVRGPGLASSCISNHSHKAIRNWPRRDRVMHV